MVMMVLLALMMAACGGPKAPETPEEKEKRIAENAIWLVKDLVRAKLKDGKSAEFRNVNFVSKGKVEVVCGEVNSKNSYGAYAGWSRFISNGIEETTRLESEVVGFPGLWKKLCIK